MSRKLKRFSDIIGRDLKEEKRLSDNLRSRLSHAVRRRARAGSAVRDLGCSILELRRHLEDQFLPGMSWGNYGVGTGLWSIDHITPLASADLSDPIQILRLCHYTNLQPLWTSDNTAKGCKV